MTEKTIMTPVEFLESRIKVLIPDDIGSQLMFKSNVEKAKAMEKERLKEERLEGYCEGLQSGSEHHPD